jgi:hypothetical protein
VIPGLLSLIGDGLSAAGAALRTRRVGFSDYEAGDYLIPTAASATIPEGVVRSAINDLPDSTLLGVAATVIDGWKPILLKTSADVTDVDVLVDALRYRASQFRAVEHDADAPFLSPTHLTNSSQSRGE